MKEKIRPFAPSLFTKVSNDLFRADTRFHLSLNAQKLLFGLCCSLTDEMTEFPVWEIHISELFSYLNLKGNSKYDTVRSCLNEIFDMKIEIRQPNGRWLTHGFLTEHGYDPDTGIVRTCFDPRMGKYFLQLKEYCKLEIQNYIKFSSKYALYLYPRLRAIANQKNAILRLSFSELHEIMFTENKKSYSKLSSSTKDILKNIIGIQKKGDLWVSTSRFNRKTGETEAYGAIHEINLHSDLYVTCDVKKKGRAYDEIHFYVAFKDNTYEGKRKEIRQIHQTYYKDENTKKMNLEAVKNRQLDIFNDSALLHSLENVKDMARAKNMDLQTFITREKLIPTEDGKHYVRCTRK